VVTSLTYSAITGDADSIGRATIEELVGGLAFSISGILMFYSIVLLLYMVKSAEAAKHGRKVLGQFITLVSFAYVCNGIDDYNDAHFDNGAPKWETGLVYGLLILYAAYAIVGYIWYDRFPHFRPSADGSPHDNQPEIRKVATASLLIVIVCAIGVGFFSAYGGDACTTPPVWVALGLMGMTLIVTLAFSVWLFMSRPSDEWTTGSHPPPAPTA
jgi:hypothetical protein